MEYPKIAIIILSFNSLKETRECIESIRRNVPSHMYELIVVDNASSDGSAAWLAQQPDIKLQLNTENVGFPKGCNQGIALAKKEADIFLLNSDTLIPKKAVEYLQQGLYSSQNVGAAGSVSNWVSNYQDVSSNIITADNYEEYAETLNVDMDYPYERKLWLVGFALLLKRTALERIGLLDERFSPGNYEDTDLGYRMTMAGYEQVLCRNSFIFHYGSRSFGRTSDTMMDLLRTNQAKFIEKWHINPERYSYIKKELFPLIPYGTEEKFSLLDIGCGTGHTMTRLQWMFPHAEMEGVECREELYEVSRYMGHITKADINDWMEHNEKRTFDVVLSGGVIEYQESLPQYLSKLKTLLADGGRVIGSLYNRECTFLCPEEGKRYYSAAEFVYCAVSLDYNVLDFSYITREGEQYMYVFCMTAK